MASFDINLKNGPSFKCTRWRRSIQSIGSSIIFYVTVLKCDYGNPITVSHLRVKSLFKFQPIKRSDRIALWNFHQKLKITIKSIGYGVPIKSNEKLAKALLWLTCYIRNEFYKVTYSLILDGDIDLIFLEK